jgi:type I restriction enzyme S subunit
MRESWKRMPLTDFIWFQRGFDLPKSKFKGGNIAVYGSTSILGYHNIIKVKAPGIITGRSGTLGKFQYAKKDFWPHNTTLWVKDFKGNNPKFAYYLLKCLDFNLFNSGGAVPTLNRNVLNAYLVEIPPLETQRKIATILSAYDDLIENNRRRITLLEEQAQLTYEEWFVRMRFPGFEKVEWDEELGLPMGWRKVKMKDCCQLTMGQSPKSIFYNYKKEGLPFHQGVKDYGFRFPKNSTWSTEGKRMANEDDILFSVRAPVGRLNIAIEKIILGRGLAAIRHKKEYNGFLFYQLQKIFFEDDIMGGGAIFNSITKKDIENVKILHATDELLISFNEFASNINEHIKNLTRQNRLLQEGRDILLPRLMLGLVDSDMSSG